MLHFTIRDLLWLMVVAAVGSILWMEHRALRLTEDAHSATKLKLSALEARLKNGLTTQGQINAIFEIDAYERGYRKGTDEVRRAQAERDTEQRRRQLGIPQSQKEAAPGIYFLQ